MELDESIWSNLPAAVLQRVVAFLPLAKLARFRCVNKDFKDWIFSPQFDALRGQLPLRSACLFLHTRNFSVTGNVEIPGVLSHSFLTGDEEFWQTYVRGFRSKKPKLLAAAGRFLFLQYFKRLAVFDLKTRTGVTLPKHNLFKGASSNTPVFGGDQSTGAFKVAVVALGGLPDEPPLGIFDSVSKTWTAETFPHALLPGTFETAILSDRLFIIFSQTFILEPAHTLFSAPNSLTALTLSRNGTTSSALHIEEILEEIPDCRVDMVRPSLHATSSHLFMVACIKDKVLILEVDFATKKYVEVSRVPERFHGSESISSTATDDCILILVDHIKGFIFDLAPKTWRTVMTYPNFKGNGMVGTKLNIFMAA